MAQSDFERMQELIELLNHCRYEYFDLCKLPPTVSNEEYDKMMQELGALQTKMQIYMSNSPAMALHFKTVEELRIGRHPKPIPLAATAEQMYNTSIGQRNNPAGLFYFNKEDSCTKCLRKYEWIKLPRDYPDMGKGLMPIQNH